MGRECILGGMKAWPLLLVGIGACAEPPRRPPVTYVPIGRAPEAPPASIVPGSPMLGADKPDKPDKDPPAAGTIVAVSTEAPPADDLCYKRLISSCCTETTVHAKKQGGKLVCPGQLVVRGRCKDVGPKCK